MPRYKGAKGRELHHSAPVDVVVPTLPRPTSHLGYEAHLLSEGDDVELPEAEGQRLVDAGVLEVPKASRRQSKK